MNLLTLSLVTALPGERTERQPGGEKVNHKRKIGRYFTYINNSLHKWYKHTCMLRFVLSEGHYLLQELNSFPRVKLEEISEL